MQQEQPLRVAFRVGRYPSRTETFISSQIGGLALRGHRVEVLADDTEDGVEGPTLPAREIGVRHLYPPGPLLAKGYQLLPYRIRRRVAVAAERRLCAQNDVVICNFGWAGAAVAASVGGRARRARLVTILHGDDMSRTLVQGGRSFYDQLFDEADLLLPVSDYWRRRLAELGAPESKLAVHHMGVDPERFAFVQRLRGPQQPFELVTVGRLVEKKGTAITMRALALLGSSMPQTRFRFRVFGDGPLRAPLMALRDRLGLRQVVEFSGALRHEEVGRALASAHAFVLPSVTAADGDMEGIPVVLMEAMASGAPVVSTWHSGIPELVEHGGTGLLVRERDADGLAQQIALLAVDAELGATLAQAARLRVQQHFNSRLQNARLESLLRDLVASTPDPTPLPTAAFGNA